MCFFLQCNRLASVCHMQIALVSNAGINPTINQMIVKSVISQYKNPVGFSVAI